MRRPRPWSSASGGTYGIAGAVEVLVDRPYANASLDANPAVAAFHALPGRAGSATS